MFNLKTVAAVLFLATGLLGAAPARAEGNCPEGMYPIDGIGFQGCAPIPGYGGYDDYGGYDSSGYDPVGADGLTVLFDYFFGGLLPDAPPARDTETPQQAQTPQAPAQPSLPEGVSAVYQSSNGVWLLFAADGACSVAFGQGRQSLIFSGPTGNRPGAITFLGPDIPAAQAASEVQVSLLADGKAAAVRAVHMAGGTHGAVIVPTVIGDTLASVGDSEAISVELAGQTVFSLQTHGTHAARDALLACLG